MAGVARKWLYIVLFPAVLLVLLIAFTPLLVREFILPPVLARVGLDGYEFSLSRFSMTGCSLHVAGRPQFPPPVVAGNIRIDWTPSGLLRRRIEKVSSNGLQINLVDLPAANNSAREKSGPQKLPAESTTLPVVIEQVEVNNGALFFPAGKRIGYLPFTFSGQRIGDQGLPDPAGAVDFKVRMEAAEHLVDGLITLHPAQGRVSGRLDSNLDPALLSLLIPSISPAREVTGKAGLAIEAAVRIAPFSLESLDVALVFADVMITGNGMSVGTLESQPARITVSGSGTRLQVEGSGFHVLHPLRTAVDFATRISFSANGPQWQGTLDLKPEPGPVLQGRLAVQDGAPLHIGYEGAASAGKFSVHLQTAQPGDAAVDSPFVVHRDELAATVAGIDLDARITYDRQAALKTLAASLLLTGGKVTFGSPQGVISVPKFAVRAEGALAPGQAGPGFTALVTMDDASLDREGQQLRAQGVQLELPVAWPSGGSMEKGGLRINTLLLDGKNLGSFRAEIVQEGKEFNVDGLLQTPLFPEEKISVTGILRLPEQQENVAELSFALPKGRFVVGNFMPLLPGLQGMEGTGTIDVHGSLGISPCGLSGQADFSLRNGHLVFKDAESEIEDINVSLRFPSLPSLSTTPMQKLSIGTIRKKKLVVNDVQAWFAIEPPGSLFIEKISGRWSGGRVFTSSFRLRQGQDELDIALFCDRLELSSILSQFGLAEAGGEGRLSGRVPLLYADGRFFVDDGFLYSTPGEKGSLKIKQSKYLETTIPAEVPQFSPLHFAGAALADFEYNWAKLQIQSEGDSLLLKLQVDGRPTEKLPFRFDQKNNVFVRLDAASGEGIDQPIKLDVNFNVPVNEIFQYKDTLMPFFRKLN